MPELINPTPNALSGLAFEAHPELQTALLPLATEETVPGERDIFKKGAAAKGIYLLIEGDARLLLANEKGVELGSRPVGAGCILGLPATLCSSSYFFTARAASDCRVGFIETARLNEFLRERTDLCMEVVQIMSRELASINKTHGHMKGCKNTGCALNSACNECA